jgi:altronate dehydratase
MHYGLLYNVKIAKNKIIYKKVKKRIDIQNSLIVSTKSKTKDKIYKMENVKIRFNSME